MLISIVVPIYNSQEYLSECIESIRNQSYQNIEIVLIDDGSTDSSPQICDSAKEKDSRIVVVHQKNSGSVATRLAGCRFATGDYITFVDSDDFIGPNRIKAFADTMVLYPNVDCVCAEISFFPDTKKKSTSLFPYGYYNEQDVHDIVANSISRPPFFSFGLSPSLVTKCIKSEFLKGSFVPNDITLGDDLAQLSTALVKVKSLSIINNDEYFYRCNPNSITHAYDPLLSKRIFSLLDFLTKTFTDAGFDMTSQLNDYAYFLTKNIVWNQLIYKDGKYFSKRRDLKKALEDFNLKRLRHKIHFVEFKDKVFFFLLKRKFYFLLYVLLGSRKRFW